MAGRAARRQVYDGRSGALAITTPRDAAATTVDGVLDEPAWRKAALLTGFSQYFPTDGVPARDSTEVFVFYTATTLNIGIRAYAPAGTVRQNLSDRDKISADDNIQLFLGTYNDSRQAMLFAVNPIGIQSDGVLIETGTVQGGGFSGGIVRNARGGRPGAGLRVEVQGPPHRVRLRGGDPDPFKSLRYRAGGEQDWQLNVVRTVQATGYEETWAPTTRSGSSFLAQSGHLRGLRELSRGLTVDLIPTVTSSVVGLPTTGKWGYDNNNPEIGGSVRWGITSNLTLSGTANPDFSQVEADATQFTYDPRVQNFFAERRPSSLESQEQFRRPSRLIYTRRITQPVGGHQVDGQAEWLRRGLPVGGGQQRREPDRRQQPRVQRAACAARHRHPEPHRPGVHRQGGRRRLQPRGGPGWSPRARILSVQGQYANSSRAPTASHQRTAVQPLHQHQRPRFGAQYAVNGIAPEFDAQSGFIARSGIANINLTNRYTSRKTGALVEAITPEIAWLNSFRYDDFVNRGRCRTRSCTSASTRG